jgi:predicted ribosome quality control (RQC) complex YloA/Tae2 family protein
MPFDGLVINSLVLELKTLLMNNRIEKIYQPESDEIVMKFRNLHKDKKLLISVNSNYPHVCLTNLQKDNPLNPPMFCMLLRKHIQGGKIIDVKQVDFERILIISIENYDELGNLSVKELIVEIMGKHSNIILVDQDTYTIIDSIKRIPINISRQRQILPGLKYEYPPTQGKINIFETDYKTYLNHIGKVPQNTPIYKALYRSFQGISPIIAKDVCYKNNIVANTLVSTLTPKDFNNIWNTFVQLSSKIQQNKFEPNIVMDLKSNILVDFSSCNLDIYNNENFTKVYRNSISSVIDEFYYEKDKYERIKQKSMDLKKIITRRLDRLHKKIQKQKEELLTAKNADKYKLYGELILANMHRITKGMKKIEVENYYEPDLHLINIPLDIRLSPSENSQKYFKKYNKFKNAFKKITVQIKETNEEINYLENVLISLENTDDLSNVEDIKQELIEQNIVKKKQKNKNKLQSQESKPHKYYSSDGFVIQAGKNNKQNDRLTLKISSKNDIWLHTKDIPGSHIIIQTEGKKVPDSTIFEAAEIAAYHSKGRHSSNVPVDYTYVKNVKKPSGAKPGMVIYDNFKTVFVTPNEMKIKELKTQN